MSQVEVIIVGAGVTGLSIALELLQQKENRSLPFNLGKLTIVSDYFPKDGPSKTPNAYASTRAGGHWRPMATSSPEDAQLREFEGRTFQKFYAQMQEEGNDGFKDVVGMVKSFDYYDKSPVTNGEQLWFHNLVPNFRQLSKDEVPTSVVYGVEYDTFVFDCPRYIIYVFDKMSNLAKTLNVKLEIVRKSLKSIEDAPTLFSTSGYLTVVVNATGLGSLELGGVNDDTCFPIRGQVLLVKAPQVKRTLTWIHGPGQMDMVIPRPGEGVVVIGGSHWANSWLGTPDETLSQKYKRNCSRLCPELGDPDKIEVLATSVGLRPGRLGGPRVAQDLSKRWLVHAYGLGGGGFQASRGLAEKAAYLVAQSVDSQTGTSKI